MGSDATTVSSRFKSYEDCWKEHCSNLAALEASTEEFHKKCDHTTTGQEAVGVSYILLSLSVLISSLSLKYLFKMELF
ncbi:hypothetical protein Btru_072355 [Bulinus truncatus]|nr:hypothetical protein Btru_072355 [Bulinus truncatus]